MKQAVFERRYGQEWQEFSQLVEALDRPRKAAPEQLHAFVPRYRRLCQLLAIARSRGYSSDLIEQLNQLALKGHHLLYRDNSQKLVVRLLQFVVVGFPQQVRKEWPLFVIAAAIFVVPAVVFYFLVQWDPSLIYSLFTADQVANFEKMYSPVAPNFGANRPFDSDFAMFGYYIYNNISIAFRCLAGGMLFMLGSIFLLWFNGLVLGGVASHLQTAGLVHNLLPFVVAHSAFELTAIVISGAAGMRLGYSLLAPGRYSRLVALKLAGKSAFRLTAGAALLLVVAAAIEAFWSSNQALPLMVKYGVGAACWLVVYCYLFLAGRHAT